MQFVRDNFMVGIKYNSLADLNGQALAWCNKVNGKVHATTNEVPFERLKKEGLSPLSREYIIDKINLRRVQKDCLISYAGNQYSVPAEYVGKDVAVVALDSMLAAYYEGKADRSAPNIVSKEGHGCQSSALPKAYVEADNGCRKCSAGTGQSN